MAILANNSSGNFTTAATWSVVNATGFTTLLATQETGTTNPTASFVSNVAFTPGAVTIDGVALKTSSISGSPTGTLSVRLALAGVAVAGTTVTVNISDLTTGPTWNFFKFTAPVILLAATAYTVQVTTSNTNQATLFRKSATASDWTFYLRTTTTQAPAAGDAFIVGGDWVSAGVNNTYTVTMDNTTATQFGSDTTGVPSLEVNSKGILAYGSAASTTYRLKVAGNIYVNTSGTFTIGTAGTPIPVSSTATLEFAEATNVKFGLFARGLPCTFTTYGATKTGRAYLASSIIATTAAITTDISTGWLSGDTIAIATTTRTIAQSETAVLSVDASGTSVTLTGGVAFAHDGSSVTSLKAEIINLTRNVKILGASTTNQAYINVSGISAVVSLNYTEFQFLGSNTSQSRGIDVATTTGSFSMTGCALKNFEVAGSCGLNFNSNSNANCTISDSVFYRNAANAVATAVSTAASLVLVNCWAIGAAAMGTAGLINLSCTGGSFTSLNTAGSITQGIVHTGLDSANFTASDWIAHSNTTANVQISSGSTTTAPVAYLNITAYRGNTRGVFIQGDNLTFTGGSLYGNLSNGLEFNGSTHCRVYSYNIFNDASFNQPIGVAFGANGANNEVISSIFGAGGLTHSTGDASAISNRAYHGGIFRNCQFNSATEMATQANLEVNGFISSAKHNQVAGSHKMWRRFGTITSDTAFFVLQSPSQRLTPNNASNKLETIEKKVAVPNGKTVKISVNVRKSAAGDGATYNGSQPRLILRGDAATGLATDTVLATSTAAGNGAFELLTATTSVVTDDVVLKLYIDCDGTLGWINIDRWSVEIV